MENGEGERGILQCVDLNFHAQQAKFGPFILVLIVVVLRRVTHEDHTSMQLSLPITRVRIDPSGQVLAVARGASLLFFNARYPPSLSLSLFTHPPTPSQISSQHHTIHNIITTSQ